MRVLKYSLMNIQSLKEELAPPDFYIMFIILTNEPYALAKYLYSTRFTTNFKDFRCFLSYVLKEDCFNPFTTLELTKRVFLALYQTIHTHTSLESNI